jgi:hypothetical protein
LVPPADEWLRDSHEDPEEEEDVKGGDMRGLCEVFEGAPDAAEGECCTETPEHGLNENGTLKLVGFFGDVEPNDNERTNEGQCREYSEDINNEAGGMKMVE